jgi:hypothetical protein
MNFNEKLWNVFFKAIKELDYNVFIYVIKKIFKKILDILVEYIYKNNSKIKEKLM